MVQSHASYLKNAAVFLGVAELFVVFRFRRSSAASFGLPRQRLGRPKRKTNATDDNRDEEDEKTGAVQQTDRNLEDEKLLLFKWLKN